MQVDIELRPHVGVTQTPLGPVQVELDQYMVMATAPEAERPLFCGFVCKHQGAPFNGSFEFARLPKALKDAIHNGVKEKLGESRCVEPAIMPEDLPADEEADTDISDEE